MPRFPDASQGWSGFGGWGGGWDFNARPSAGRLIAYQSQIRHDVLLDVLNFFRWLPPGAVYSGGLSWVVNQPTYLGEKDGYDVWGGGGSYTFRMRMGWDNYLDEGSGLINFAGGAGRTRSRGTTLAAPIRLPPLPYAKCFHSYRFSSNFTGTGRTIVEAMEFGGFLSFSGDAVATTYKIKSRSGYIGGTKNRGAGGLNYVFRRMADAVKNPGLKGKLTGFGNRATPWVSGFGVFTLSYNLTVAAQCRLGVLN